MLLRTDGTSLDKRWGKNTFSVRTLIIGMAPVSFRELTRKAPSSQLPDGGDKILGVRTCLPHVITTPCLRALYDFDVAWQLPESSQGGGAGAP